MDRLGRRLLHLSRSHRRTGDRGEVSSAGASWSRCSGIGKLRGAQVVADFECSLAAAV